VLQQEPAPPPFKTLKRSLDLVRKELYWNRILSFGTEATRLIYSLFKFFNVHMVLDLLFVACRLRGFPFQSNPSWNVTAFIMTNLLSDCMVSFSSCVLIVGTHGIDALMSGWKTNAVFDNNEMLSSLTTIVLLYLFWLVLPSVFNIFDTLGYKAQHSRFLFFCKYLVYWVTRPFGIYLLCIGLCLGDTGQSILESSMVVWQFVLWWAVRYTIYSPDPSS
jgi:hypothetical protein